MSGDHDARRDAFLDECDFMRHAPPFNFARRNLSGLAISQQDKHGNWRGPLLCHTDLHDSDLRGTNLRSAHLEVANLTSTRLDGADFRGARFGEEASFQDAHLFETDFRACGLRKANFTGAHGLEDRMLGGADLAGAKLPKDVAQFDVLGQVDEASKNARQLFYLMLSLCLLGLVTIGTTTDVKFFTEGQAAKIPLLGIDIPLIGFYIVVPLILAAIYVYFHLYLQHLWQLMATLPAVFPDGRALDERAYPWLLNAQVRVHFPWLRDRPHPNTKFQHWANRILAWWVPPFVLYLLWGRALVRHDLVMSGLHVLLFGFAVYFGARASHLADRTLSLRDAQCGESMRHRLLYCTQSVLAGAAVVWTIGATPLANYGAFNPYVFAYYINSHITHFDVNVPHDPRFRTDECNRWRGLRLYVCADLREATLSTQPTDNSEEFQGIADQVKQLRGARLRHANLIGTLASGSFLAGADFREAHLVGAVLSRVNLSRATLEGATLAVANLDGANLSSANLDGTNLEGASAMLANFEGASLVTANLTGSILQGAKLKGANLKGAKLIQAKLSQADLAGAILESADLQGANLLWANLDGANLLWANPSKSDLESACLSNATTLPYEFLPGVDQILNGSYAAPYVCNESWPCTRWLNDDPNRKLPPECGEDDTSTSPPTSR